MVKYKLNSAYKVDAELKDVKNLTCDVLLDSCRRFNHKGFTYQYAVARYESWFCVTNRTDYTAYVCRNNIPYADTIWGEIKRAIPGFRKGNSTIGSDNVFNGYHTFFFDKYDAESEDFNFNGVGKHMETIIIEGMLLMRLQYTNVWN